MCLLQLPLIASSSAPWRHDAAQLDTRPSGHPNLHTFKLRHVCIFFYPLQGILYSTVHYFKLKFHYHRGFGSWSQSYLLVFVPSCVAPSKRPFLSQYISKTTNSEILFCRLAANFLLLSNAQSCKWSTTKESSVSDINFKHLPPRGGVCV